MLEEPQPHDAHVELAKSVFRSVGFTLAAMQYKRSPEALAGLKRYNGAAPDWAEPFAWRYHPNAYMQANWRKYYG